MSITTAQLNKFEQCLYQATGYKFGKTRRGFKKWKAKTIVDSKNCYLIFFNSKGGQVNSVAELFK